MVFKRSCLMFPCVDGDSIPHPLNFLRAHIESPSEVILLYNFVFNSSELININYTSIVRTCEKLCLYDLDNIQIET